LTKIAIIIPAMNEQRSIVRVIDELRAKFDYPIIVIDDASTDNTRFVAIKHGAIVIPHVTNLGAWRATQTGLRYALNKGFDAVITCDADGQHPAQAVESLIEQANESDLLVIGSCLSRGSAGRHIAWRVFKRLSGLSVSDLTSGLRLYRRDAIAVLVSPQATMFEYQDVGVLLMLQKLNMSCSEVGVQMQERTDGISRIFYSWSAVMKYLIYTLILSVAKLGPQRREKYHKQLMASTNNE
jgi:glycosyltransferase involved in cell wall biosynthesis